MCPDIVLPKIKIESVMSALSETIDWGLRDLSIPEWWKETKGKGIKVAVLDTGIDKEHSDLKDAIDDVVDLTGSPSKHYDKSSHGTHCAGIIGARANGIGIIGVAPECRLYIAKVLDDYGKGDYNWIIQGINWAMSRNVDIISMSLGGPDTHGALHMAIRKAVKNSAVVIAAAGNEGYNNGDTINYPAKFPETISVGSIDQDMERSNFSSVGDMLDIMAPGGKIYSTVPPNRYGIMSGTSMATPYVSGLACLVLAKHRNKPGSKTPISGPKSCEQIREHLIRTAKPMDDVRKYGHGIVNPKKLLKES